MLHFREGGGTGDRRMTFEAPLHAVRDALAGLRCVPVVCCVYQRLGWTWCIMHAYIYACIHTYADTCIHRYIVCWAPCLKPCVRMYCVQIVRAWTHTHTLCFVALQFHENGSCPRLVSLYRIMNLGRVVCAHRCEHQEGMCRVCAGVTSLEI